MTFFDKSKSQPLKRWITFDCFPYKCTTNWYCWCKLWDNRSVERRPPFPVLVDRGNVIFIRWCCYFARWVGGWSVGFSTFIFWKNESHRTENYSETSETDFLLGIWKPLSTMFYRYLGNIFLFNFTRDFF